MVCIRFWIAEDLVAYENLALLYRNLKTVPMLANIVSITRNAMHLVRWSHGLLRQITIITFVLQNDISEIIVD